MIFKMHWIVEGSLFVFLTIYTVYRVTLVVVLKRVIEINEDIMLRIITISVFGVMASAVFCLIPGYKFNSVASRKLLSGHSSILVDSFSLLIWQVFPTIVFLTRDRGSKVGRRKL